MMVVTWPGQRSPETRTSPLLKSALSAAGMVLWTQQTEKLSSPYAGRGLDGQGGGGHGGFEAHPEKHQVFLRGLPGQFHRIQGGVNHPHLGPLGPQAFQGGVGAGDPEHVAEGDQDHVGFGPQGQEGVQV